GSRGRGLAERARGMGASVIVCEADPVRALEASLDGYRLMPMNEAAASGDVFLTATSVRGVMQRDHFEKLRSGAILVNCGRCDNEIDIEGLARLASSRRHARESLEEFVLRDGRRISVAGEGRPFRTAAETLPPTVLDVSFALQALAVEYLVKSHAGLAPGLH